MSAEDFRRCEQAELEFWLSDPNTVLVPGEPFGVEGWVIHNPLILKNLEKQGKEKP